jgi:hypothetical protein
LVIMEPQRKLIFESLILNDIRYNEHYMLENDDIHYMTIFTCFLKWRHIGASDGQHLDHLGKKMLKQKCKWTWTKGKCEKRCINQKRKKNHLHTYT